MRTLPNLASVATLLAGISASSLIMSAQATTTSSLVAINSLFCLSMAQYDLE
jgi:hypothetical protein